MIVIVSSASREAAALTALCEHRNWPCQPCPTVDRFITINEQFEPRALVIRHRLEDGYSDDVFNFLKTTPVSVRPRVIVLMAADSSGKAEARQIELGADCVMRDPVRIEVLLEYLAKYRTARSALGEKPSTEVHSYTVAGVQMLPHEHQIIHHGEYCHIAPQEVALLRMLARSEGKVITYPALYEELLNRKFAGDTTNCRVLLGKVCSSFKRLGVDLKAFVQVIPKSGYLYSAAPKSSLLSKTARQSERKLKERRRQAG